MSQQAASQRATIRQAPKRAYYDKTLIYSIIDEAIIASVAVSIDDQPFVLPMAVARIGDHVYLHGSRKSRLIRHLAAGNEVCLSVAHVDGIVVARSAMHCSANYRSVVVHGRGRAVEGDDKAALLQQVVYRVIAGSQGDYREPSPSELKATSLIELSLQESACKMRSGGPIDDSADLSLPFWAGVIPVQQSYGAPIPADNLAPEIATPKYASDFQRPND
jgi:nitroimidazol reductase NimA-like FMN-containing flavoprotein (pyridoxamine 5'-phosphate oxidase superfamily)